MADSPQRLGVGGTPGGMGEFLIGFVCAVAGGYLLFNQVTVGSGSWMIYGMNAFGLSLIPFLIGVAMLFFNGKSVFGWLLLLGSVVIIIAGVLINLSIWFRPTSLFNTLLMLALLAAGIGLILRSLRAH